MIHPNSGAQSIIKRIEYATLATVDENGMPWNAPVYVAYDEYYNFYFGSHVFSQHAKNVAANDHVFVSIYDSTVSPGTGSGAYIQARCKKLIDTHEIDVAHKLIENRRNPIPYWKREQFKVDGPIALYKITPDKIWLNGDDRVAEIYIDTRVNGEKEE